MNNLSEQDDIMMVELNEKFLEESVFTTHHIDKRHQEDMKAYIKLIALLISSEKPEMLIDTTIAEETMESVMSETINTGMPDGVSVFRTKRHRNGNTENTATSGVKVSRPI